MPGSLDRRRFLAAAAALPLAGLAGLRPPEGGLGRPADDPRSRSPGPDGLPPSVVGLRTSGGNFRFDPPGLHLEGPTTLRWLNMGDFHTTTAFHPDNAGLLGGDVPLRIPEGAAPWHSGMLGLTAGTQFETELEVEGVYDYFCQPHNGFGMVGRLVVGEPRGGPGTRPMDGLPPAVRENMPALERLTGDAGRSYAWAARLNGVLHLLANDRDAAAPAGAIVEAMSADAALARHLGGGAARERAVRAAKAFADAVAAGEGYERLVTLADDVKENL